MAKSTPMSMPVFGQVQYIQVQITFPDLESANRVAEKLVSEHLAACTQVAGTICSRYVWESKKETSNEVLLLAKTNANRFDRLVEFVRREHPYQCPQIIGLPIIACSEDYRHWLDEQLGGEL